MSTCKLFENCYNPCKTVIKSLQQENERLQTALKLSKQDVKDVMKDWEQTIEELTEARRENEQLRAQVTVTMEVLDELTSEIDYAGTIDNGIEWDKHKSIAFNKALDLLNTKPIDYHELLKEVE